METVNGGVAADKTPGLRSTYNSTIFPAKPEAIAAKPASAAKQWAVLPRVHIY
jgi:hypothetical protein